MKHFAFFTQRQVQGLFVLFVALSCLLGFRTWPNASLLTLPPIPAFPPATPPPTRLSLCLDVNRAQPDQWDSLPGIGPVLSKRIVAYRNKRGGFQAETDLQKVYGLSDSTYAEIEPYLTFVSPPAPKRTAPQRSKYRASKKTYPKTPPRSLPLVELNQADSTLLDAVPGIGPKLAIRILKYRKILGYFYHPDQLQAIYGLSSENFQRMRPYLKVQMPADPPRKDLNTANEWLIARLAFWDKTEAACLLTLRKKLGRFDRWEELNGCGAHHERAMEELQQYFFLPGSFPNP